MALTDVVLLSSWNTFISLFVLALVSTSLARRLHAWYRLRHIRGPFWAAFSRWWMIRHVGGDRMHLDLREVNDKYGPLARIGPDTLVTSDPNLLRRMLGVRTRYRRSDWYDAMRLDPARDNVLSMRNDEKHEELRAKMAAGYSGREVEGLEKRIDEDVAALVNLVERKYLSTDTDYRPLDFGRKAQYFTLDVISHIAFGDPFGCLATDSDMYEYIKTTEDNLPAIIMVSVLPRLSKALQSPILKSLLPSDKDPIGLGKIMGIAKQVVGERFGANKKVQPDMLGSFIAHGLTQSEAESETLVQILAGSDTTATAMRATMLHILTNPRVYSKLLAEIIDKAPSSPIRDAEARQMPYLQAVIKEGLRIFPPVTGLMSKNVPEGGDSFNGSLIPEGTKIGYSAFGLSRNRAVWGNDADVFRPERWLRATPDKLREQEAALDLVFGYGRWQCLGKNIALIELNKVFVELLRKFDLCIVDPTTPWNSKNRGIFTQSEMWIRATRRDYV
ncbi:cytochrome P450 [Lasiosphaeria hispida]|uniref:Cytochrome P450 monooxygenase ABA1 n=1 Tax=Lasiosphaeria hispida TaxID=260671 RepID=A0AAJ0HCW7_9PEZI|nr:cytochrome P450 [Lasiosphaeria hispida]